MPKHLFTVETTTIGSSHSVGPSTGSMIPGFFRSWIFDYVLDDNQKVRTEASGQSYKHFTIIIYDPRVIIRGVFKSGMTLES